MDPSIALIVTLNVIALIGIVIVITLETLRVGNWFVDVFRTIITFYVVGILAFDIMIPCIWLLAEIIIWVSVTF